MIYSKHTPKGITVAHNPRYDPKGGYAMTLNESVSFLQKQALITAEQVATMQQYVRDNCTSEMWKDVFLTELRVVRERMILIERRCAEFLTTQKAS